MYPCILDLVVRLLATCCPVPLFDELTPSHAEPAFDATSARIWACFVAGTVVLTLSFWAAAWLILKLF